MRRQRCALHRRPVALIWLDLFSRSSPAEPFPLHAQKYGETALEFAGRGGHYGSMELLLKAGADPNHVNQASNERLSTTARLHCAVVLAERLFVFDNPIFLRPQQAGLTPFMNVRDPSAAGFAALLLSYGAPLHWRFRPQKGAEPQARPGAARCLVFIARSSPREPRVSAGADMERTFQEYSAAINERPFVWESFTPWADVVGFAREAAKKRRQLEAAEAAAAAARLAAAERALRDSAREAIQTLEARTSSHVCSRFHQMCRHQRSSSSRGEGVLLADHRPSPPRNPNPLTPLTPGWGLAGERRRAVPRGHDHRQVGTLPRRRFPRRAAGGARGDAGAGADAALPGAEGVLLIDEGGGSPAAGPSGRGGGG